QVEGSNVDLVERLLRGRLGDRLSLHFARRAPAVVARLNAMNARFLAADRFVRMVVDPDACPELIKDFEQVHLKEGAHHVEIDKPKSGPGKLRSHLCFRGDVRVETLHGVLALRELPTTGMVRGPDG